MSTGKDLVPAASFDLTALPSIQEIGEVMQNNLEGGVDFKFPEIKIPSGGGIVWEIPTDEEEPRTEKELIGVILDYHPFNIYFKSEYTGEKTMPDCVARDGITGEGSPGGNCKKCNLGGDTPEAWTSGKDGIGKACANKIRVALLMEGDYFPYAIALPPTSTKGFKEYLNALTNKLKAYQGVVTRIKLIKEQSSGGITYSRAVFSKVSDLEKKDAGQMLAYAKSLRPYIRQAKLEDEMAGDDAETIDVAGAVDGGGNGEEGWS